MQYTCVTGIIYLLEMYCNNMTFILIILMNMNNNEYRDKEEYIYVLWTSVLTTLKNGIRLS